jgi:hypothetical protein
MILNGSGFCGVGSHDVDSNGGNHDCGVVLLI